MERVESAKTADTRRGFTLSTMTSPDCPWLPGPKLPFASRMLPSHREIFPYCPSMPTSGGSVTVHWVLLRPATAVRLLGVKRARTPSILDRLAGLEETGRIGWLNVLVAVTVRSFSYMR